MTNSSRLPLYLGLTVWFALLGYRGYDYFEFNKAQKAEAEARAAKQAELQAMYDERQRITVQSLDPTWEGHQKMEIRLESIEMPKSITSFRSKNSS